MKTKLTVKPMLMQLAEPEFMCPECGFKFYGIKRFEECPHCNANFIW